MIPHVIDIRTKFTQEKDSQFWADHGQLGGNSGRSDSRHYFRVANHLHAARIKRAIRGTPMCARFKAWIAICHRALANHQ
jgi:hypothetical protein